MSEGKFFQKTKIHELKAELMDTRDTKHTRKLNALKRILSNMSLGQDMSLLFNEVINCLSHNNIEMKRIVYLYLQHYAKQKPDLSIMVMNSLTKDIQDANPLVQVMALKTIPFIATEKTTNSFSEVLRRVLQDKNPYVKKSAVMCVAKISHTLALTELDKDKEWAEREGLLEIVKALVHDPSPAVMTTALTALTQIAEVVTLKLEIDFITASKLATALNECIEWHQIQVIEYLINFVPSQQEEALSLCEKTATRLQHANSGIVLATSRLIIYLSNWITDTHLKQSMLKRILPPLITLLNHFPEVQFVVLKNILLLLQHHSFLFQSNTILVKSFFVKYNDPIYVKLVKLEILVRLVDEETVGQVVTELKEYAQEVDIEFARKATKSIGTCAMKVESMASKCINALVELSKTQINYIVQEVIVVMKDIFRCYPNKYEGLISQLCEHLGAIDEMEAKAAMIWIVGQYSDRIENSVQVMEEFYAKWEEEPYLVKMSILVALVKSFCFKPKDFEVLVKDVLKKCSESDHPDLRDRGLMYWRLISKDPKKAKQIIVKDKPEASVRTADLEEHLLMELVFYFGMLPTITNRTPKHKKLKLKQKIEDEVEILSPEGGFHEDLMDDNTFIDKLNQYNQFTQNNDTQIQININNDSNDDDEEEVVKDISSTKSIKSVPSIRRDMWQMADSNFGIGIEGHFSRENNSLFVILTIINTSPSLLTGCSLFFDKNHFGLSPAMPCSLTKCQVNAHSSADFKVLITITPNKTLRDETGTNLNILKCAFASLLGSSVFTIKIPLKYMTLIAPLQLPFERFMSEAKQLATTGAMLIKSVFPSQVIKQTIPPYDDSGLLIVHSTDANVFSINVGLLKFVYTFYFAGWVKILLDYSINE